MDYMDVVRDFANRTMENLNFVQSAARRDPGEVFEVTQLINSLLGLLIFPQQEYYDSIPETSLEDLAAMGWPIPQVQGDYPQAKDLRDLIRLLRNSISHFNIRFQSDERLQLYGLDLWNIHPRSGKRTWMATISINEIEILVRKFVELLLSNRTVRSRRGDLGLPGKIP